MGSHLIRREALSRIVDPAGFFRDLALLHDARVEGVEWLGESVVISVDDLYSGFLGLPEYPGLTAASIVFGRVKEFNLNSEPAGEKLSVFDIDLRHGPSDNTLAVEISLAPGGRIRIRCETIEGDFDPDAARNAVRSDD